MCAVTPEACFRLTPVPSPENLERGGRSTATDGVRRERGTVRRWLPGSALRLRPEPKDHGHGVAHLVEDARHVEQPEVLPVHGHGTRDDRVIGQDLAFDGGLD